MIWINQLRLSPAHPRRSAETLGAVAHMPARLIWIGAFVAALAVPFATHSAVADSQFLSACRDAFSAARALPLGSRPPPPALELGRLVNIPFATLRGYLGPSTRLDCNDLLHVPVDACASFTYGPGPDTTTATFGGPWLLVVGISKGLVIEARWLGQR
jgi:hypothetical protein